MGECEVKISISEKEVQELYKKIRVTGEVWLVTINRGVILKAKAKTAMADELLRKKPETIVGCYDELVQFNHLIDDLEYCGAVIE